MNIELSNGVNGVFFLRFHENLGKFSYRSSTHRPSDIWRCIFTHLAATVK